MPKRQRRLATDPVVKHAPVKDQATLGTGVWYWVGTKKAGYGLLVRDGRVVTTWKAKYLGRKWKEVKAELKQKGKSIRKLDADEPPF